MTRPLVKRESAVAPTLMLVEWTLLVLAYHRTSDVWHRPARELFAHPCTWVAMIPALALCALGVLRVYRGPSPVARISIVVLCVLGSLGLFAPVARRWFEESLMDSSGCVDPNACVNAVSRLALRATAVLWTIAWSIVASAAQLAAMPDDASLAVRPRTIRRWRLASYILIGGIVAAFVTVATTPPRVRHVARYARVINPARQPLGGAAQVALTHDPRDQPSFVDFLIREWLGAPSHSGTERLRLGPFAINHTYWTGSSSVRFWLPGFGSLSPQSCASGADDSNPSASAGDYVLSCDARTDVCTVVCARRSPGRVVFAYREQIVARSRLGYAAMRGLHFLVLLAGAASVLSSILLSRRRVNIDDASGWRAGVVAGSGAVVLDEGGAAVCRTPWAVRPGPVMFRLPAGSGPYREGPVAASVFVGTREELSAHLARRSVRFGMLCALAGFVVLCAWLRVAATWLPSWSRP